MKSLQIGPRITMLSALRPDYRGMTGEKYAFDGIMENTWVLTAEGEAAAFGVPAADDLNEWTDMLRETVGNRALRYLFVTPVPSAAAAADAVLAVWPGCIVAGGAAALDMLRGFPVHPYRELLIRGSRKLPLGEHTLSAFTLPGRTDTDCVYLADPEAGCLFSPDFFGSLCCEEKLLLCPEDRPADFRRGAALWADEIRTPERARSLAALTAAAAQNGIRFLCPLTGPAVECGPGKPDEIFLSAVREKPAAKEIALVYTPGRFIPLLVSELTAGAKESGAVLRMYDLSRLDRDEVLAGIYAADMTVFGIPEEHGRTARAFTELAALLRPEYCGGKQAALVISAAGEKCTTAELHYLLGAAGFQMPGADLILRGKPDAAMFTYARDYGYNLGCVVQKIPNTRKPVLMKCLVCGEIFDASLGVCPTCGAGLEQCVPVNEDEVSFRHDTSQRYVILGGGIAALSAAEAIRKRDTTGEIVMVSDEAEAPISRPLLSKEDRTKSEPEKLPVKPDAWYADHKISLRLNTKALALDTAAKTVALDDGSQLSYDKLVYALGSEPAVPPFPGREKQNVLTMRHKRDLDTLNELAERAKTAAVIGGGAIGLELGGRLTRAGLKVTVLEASPQIMLRQIDADSAACIRSAMAGLGVPCEEGVSIAEITGGESCDGVRLADGRWFPADIVIVSCGIRPTTGIAKAAGIPVGRGVTVNSRMETGIPDIWACGDCAEQNGINLGLWTEASGQGAAAGANAAGDSATYPGGLIGIGQEFFGTSFYAIGDAGKRQDLHYRKVVIADEETCSRETYWFSGGVLQGAVLINRQNRTAAVQQAVTNRVLYETLFG